MENDTVIETEVGSVTVGMEAVEEICYVGNHKKTLQSIATMRSGIRVRTDTGVREILPIRLQSCMEPDKFYQFPLVLTFFSDGKLKLAAGKYESYIRNDGEQPETFLWKPERSGHGCGDCSSCGKCC